MNRIKYQQKGKVLSFSEVHVDTVLGVHLYANGIMFVYMIISSRPLFRRIVYNEKVQNQTFSGVYSLK